MKRVKKIRPQESSARGHVLKQLNIQMALKSLIEVSEKLITSAAMHMLSGAIVATSTEVVTLLSQLRIK